MNFLISPEGELQMKSKMDERGKIIAGKFVDELVKVGALLPADGKLRANSPLFCVDKASQPGEKRCIADCKKGRQNACTGQDLTCTSFAMTRGSSPSCMKEGGLLSQTRQNNSTTSPLNRMSDVTLLDISIPSLELSSCMWVSLWVLQIPWSLPVESTMELSVNCEENHHCSMEV